MVMCSTSPTTTVPSVLVRTSLVVVFHERIAVLGRRRVRLLDHARADPTDQIEERPGLVVRAGSAGSAERLQTDHGAGRLVVDVEVAGRVDELLRRLSDGLPISREDGARH